ncbi:MAG: DUF1345 domain-containing protein [Rhizomicrobium sp.]
MELRAPITFSHHWHHHAKFYASLALGAAALAIALFFHLRMPVAIAADAFFLSFIAAFAVTVPWMSPDKLKARAQVEDEGALVVSLIIFAVIAYCCEAIFMTLNTKPPAGPGWTALSLAGAPLGWLVIQLNETLHYSNLFYAKPGRGQKRQPPLEFPGTEDPGVAEFLYFSMVIGMTAQTSDVGVKSAAMRNAVTLHGFVSFFFNTVLIALAVNAAVSH